VRRNATLVIGIVLLGAGAAVVFGIDRSVRGIEAPAIGLVLAGLGAVIVLTSLLPHASSASGGHDGEERVRHLGTPPNPRRSTDDDRWPDAAGPRSR
jgi:hypothetical protein